MLIDAYFDESGHSADSRVVTVAGVAAPREIWDWFERTWDALLEAGGVKQFHMVQFENRRGEFSGWDDDLRRTFLHHLIRILHMPDFFPFGIAVLMDDWRAMPEWRQEWFKDPYAVGVSMVIQLVTGSFPDVEKFNFIFDRVPRLRGAAVEAYEFAKKEAPRDIVGSFRFASSHESKPLQLADFVAYEFRKYARNKLFDPGRPVRWTMEKLSEKNCSFFAAQLSNEPSFERWL